jgi:hypothetical protein
MASSNTAKQMGRSAKPSVPLSEMFHSVEQGVVASIMKLDPKERAIVATRVSRLFCNPQGVKNSKSKPGKPGKGKPPPVATPSNAALKRTLVGQILAEFGKHLAKLDDGIKSQAYVVNRALLRIRADHKKPMEERKFTQLGEAKEEPPSPAQLVELTEHAMGNWKAATLFPKDKDVNVAELIETLGDDVIQDLINLIVNHVVNKQTNKIQQPEAGTRSPLAMLAEDDMSDEGSQASSSSATSTKRQRS